VDETDLGKIVPGMPARITVASYPGRRFTGTIEKIEPQATVEQNVTLFPVLISLPNEEHLLRPGMNVEARFEVARRDDALTVPVVTGVTDLDRVEVTSGLAEGDVVLVLPSSSLLETQERLQNFMRGRGGIPGITQQSQQSSDSQGTPRSSQGAGSGQRPAGGQRPANGQRPAGTQRPAGGQP
jgi:HlyD family secretion protein